MFVSQKFHVPKRIVWAMLKKRKISMPKGMREKMHAKEHEEKKRKKEEIKTAHTFK
jgi:Tfp pilus assembly protein PilZ